MDKNATLGAEFTDRDLEGLRIMLYKAQMLFYGDDERRGGLKSLMMSGGQQQKIFESDLKETIDGNGGVVLEYIQGNWRLVNKRSGGNPFHQTLTAFYQGKICFEVHYLGRFSTMSKGACATVDAFLQQMMLLTIPEMSAYTLTSDTTGPGGIEFWISCDQCLKRFRGSCVITAPDNEAPGADGTQSKASTRRVLEMVYHGGVLNLR